jgi:hypothetical protein
VVLARSGSLEGMMKRLAIAAFLLLAVTTAGVEARSLPQAKSVLDRNVGSHVTPFVRGPKAKVPEPVRDAGRNTHGDLHLTHAVRAK